MTKQKIKEVSDLCGDVKRLASISLKQLELFRHDCFISGTKASGALRRKSMDLTRALAELRAGK